MESDSNSFFSFVYIAKPEWTLGLGHLIQNILNIYIYKYPRKDYYTPRTLIFVGFSWSGLNRMFVLILKIWTGIENDDTYLG